jgi:hypothetical protein
MTKITMTGGALSLLWLSAVFATTPGGCVPCPAGHAGTRCETRADLPSIIALHFSIRAYTAGWSLSFTCRNAHCAIRNSHRPHRSESPERFVVITVSDGAL